MAHLEALGAHIQSSPYLHTASRYVHCYVISAILTYISTYVVTFPYSFAEARTVARERALFRSLKLSRESSTCRYYACVGLAIYNINNTMYSWRGSETDDLDAGFQDLAVPCAARGPCPTLPGAMVAPDCSLARLDLPSRGQGIREILPGSAPFHANPLASRLISIYIMNIAVCCI
jgi:hypothetical protein